MRALLILRDRFVERDVFASPDDRALSMVETGLRGRAQRASFNFFCPGACPLGVHHERAPE
jgi:hypothetical protein